MNRKDLISSREYWVETISNNLWNANGSMESEADRWNDMAQKVVTNHFMSVIDELSNQNKH